ncbi:MAG: FAD-dependent monooxygenase [Pseudomonadota bacterium]|nr:FAD-dependent monooxygenase [Pseudomonadota bacterium]
MIDTHSQHQVILTGNGLTAQIMALCLYHAGCNILWLAGKPMAGQKKTAPDNRTTTIHQAGMKMLDALGITPLLASPAWPINRILVSDRPADDRISGQKKDVYKTDWPMDWHHDQPMAHVVLNHDLQQACNILIDRYQIHPKQVNITTINKTGRRLVIDSDGTEYPFDLLVICAGGRTELIGQAGFRKISQKAGQTALVGMLASSTPTEHTAYQRFLAEGPLALMAMDDRHFSLVWTVSDQSADRLMALDLPELDSELNRQFGEQAGQLRFCAPPLRWPLSPHYVRKIAKDGIVLAGDSAHGLHPLAGMGLNLGLADAACLLDCLMQARKRGLTPAHISICDRYQAQRQAEIFALSATTQLLNRWFSRPEGLVRMVGGVGMSLVGRSVIMGQLKQLAMGGRLSRPQLFSGKLPQ